MSPLHLRSAFKAILLALLPGLEDENSEEFERTFVILNKFRAIIGREPAQNSGREDGLRDQFFWQCIFLASITSSSRRQGALSYLTRSLPKLGAPRNTNSASSLPMKTDLARLTSDMEAVASPEPGLLIRCFDAGLRDEHLLIQRGFLDLLVTHLPLHSGVLHAKVVPEDLERLVAAAVSVVGRREMSLNRRLWTWFLGPESSRQKPDNISPSQEPSEQDHNTESDSQRPENQSEYFERYGLRPLVSSIRKLLLHASTVPLIVARPFRICLSLMDRWEIGGLVVPLVFWEALESVWRYQRKAPSKESFTEVLRSAAVFFDGVESDLIWRKIYSVVHISFHVEQSQLQQVQERLDLVQFIITKFNVQEEEMLTIHVPSVALLMLMRIRNQHRQLLIQQSASYLNIFGTLLTICSLLVEMIPARALIAKSSTEKTNSLPAPGENEDFPSQELLDNIELFYEREGTSAEKDTPPIPSEDLGRYLLDNIIKIIIDDLTSIQVSSTLKTKLAIFDMLLRKFPKSGDWDFEDLLTALERSSQELAAEASDKMQFERVPSILVALEAIHFVQPAARWQSDHRIRRIIPDLISSLWSLLSPSKLELNVEAARCVLRLRKISPESELVESSITTLMIGGEVEARKRVIDVEAGRRFATLWAHSMLTPSIESLVHRSTFLYEGLVQERKAGQAGNNFFILSRPLLLLIDSLFDSKTDIFAFVKSWISSHSTVQM